MALTDWDWRLPAQLQDVPWDCAAASLTWCLNAAGYPLSEADVVAGLGPERISPAFGLLDASGGGLVDYLGEIGITASNNGNASWDEIVDAAGYQPMLIGGRAWYHWTGVRIGGPAANLGGRSTILIANPAPGWMGVGQWMDESQFYVLGPFSAVWFIAW